MVLVVKTVPCLGREYGSGVRLYELCSCVCFFSPDGWVVVFLLFFSFLSFPHVLRWLRASSSRVACEWNVQKAGGEGWTSRSSWRPPLMPPACLSTGARKRRRLTLRLTKMLLLLLLRATTSTQVCVKRVCVFTRIALRGCGHSARCVALSVRPMCTYGYWVEMVVVVVVSSLLLTVA